MSIVPTGFRQIGHWDGVMAGFAPIFMRREDDGHIEIGFHVGPKHCNPNGDCHGGTWATMADILMGVNVGSVTGMGGPTVSMSIDFLGSARGGQWVEGRAHVLRWTPRIAFAECRFVADGEPALRANAVFRRKIKPLRDYEAMFAAQA